MPPRHPSQLGLLFAMLLSCVSAESRRGLLGRCLFNDECDSPLVCAAGQCRAACRSDRDCANEWRCLSAGELSRYVCYPPEDLGNACVYDSHCRGGRICGGDRVCRLQCATDFDCEVIAPGLSCLSSGVCSAHPFLDGGALADVDLNLRDARAPSFDAVSTGDAVTTPGDLGGSTATMPTTVMGTGCGPSSDPRSCTPGRPGCVPVEVQSSREGYSRCVRFADGSVRCWGDGYANSLGIGGIPMPPCRTPFIAQRLHGASQLELGGGSACAMFTRGVWCWGSNFNNNVGGGMGQTPLPIAIDEAPDGLGTLTAGHGNTTCLVRPDGALRCWGQNSNAELGQGDNVPRRGPVTVPLTEVLAVSPGETHVCAIRRDGTVWCWGANCAGESGQMPASPPTNLTLPRCVHRVMTPTQVMGLSDVRELATGRYFSCARRGDGQVLCWGWNEGGALGRGSAPRNGFDPTPAPVLGINDAQRLTSGDGYGACVLRADRSVWCWGGTSNGGAMVTPGRPFQVPSLTSVRSLAARAPCATLDNDEVWCWGGQVGDPMVPFAMVPTRVMF